MICERCYQRLDSNTAVRLELDTYTGLYHDPSRHEVEPEDSQGLFTFGADCAAKVLANGGKIEKRPPFRRR